MLSVGDCCWCWCPSTSTTTLHYGWVSGTHLIYQSTDQEQDDSDGRAYFCWSVAVWSMWGSSGAHFEPLVSFCSASREMTWPQTRRTGGLVSVLCWRRIGHANIEWNRHSGPRSISIYRHISRQLSDHQQPRVRLITNLSVLCYCISFHHFNVYVENFPSYVPLYLYVCWCTVFVCQT